MKQRSTSISIWRFGMRDICFIQISINFPMMMRKHNTSFHLKKQSYHSLILWFDIRSTMKGDYAKSIGFSLRQRPSLANIPLEWNGSLCLQRYTAQFRGELQQFSAWIDYCRLLLSSQENVINKMKDNTKNCWKGSKSQ